MIQNITLSAEPSLIKRAREKAIRENKSLNMLFRNWLNRYVGQQEISKHYKKLMDRLHYAKADLKFSRRELNEH